ncbi:FAD/NAD(P)-binding domain-containing protein, partial [Rickenella mellea]
KKHAGQRVVVVGSGNSAADICQDVAVRGAAKVTMVQRSPTVVVSDKVTAFRTAMAFPDGAPQDVIDLKNTGTPLALLRIIMVENQKWANMLDKDMHDGLKKAGFMVTDGPDGAGHLLRVYEKARGFFIDVGCSALIADGKVHVKPGQEISKITEKSVVFADGEEIEADAIVWATGYDGPKPKWSRIFGEEVVDRIGEVWGMNEEGEVRAGYKPTEQPGLYFCGGDFAVSRMYTKQLALYIRAIEAGLLKQ